MNTTPANFVETRECFRIDDNLELFYRQVLDNNELENPNYNFDITDNSQQHDFLTALAILNNETQELLPKIIEDDPLTANYVKILEQKISLLTKTIIYQTNSSPKPKHLVNLSEAGIAFGINEMVKINDIYRLKLILPPMLQEIAVYGKVTRVATKEQAKKFDPKYLYWIAIAFTHIRNSDRQLLARYILQKQTLKNKKI